MTVQELFRLVCWPAVERALRKFYPHHACYLPAFRQVFAYVRGCAPEPNPEGWYVVVELQDAEGDWFGVPAFRPGDDTRYGMDFQMFEAWAGTNVAEETLRRFPPAEVAAHILWEMTFWGFDNETITARGQEILGRPAGHAGYPVDVR